jgi:hypothetical protein
MTDHTARPESWAEITRWAVTNHRVPVADCLLDLHYRVEQLEQAQQPVQYEAPITEAEDAIRRLAALARSNDLNGQSVAVMTWRGVADWLTEQAQQQGQPATTERPRWGEGICGDGAAILRDGVMVPIEQVIARLNQAEAADDRIANLRKDLERERLRLTACGVVAMSDTPKSAASARDVLPEYQSESLNNVASMVDQLMETRAKLQILEQELQRRLPRVLHFHGVPLVPPIDCPDPMLWIAERVYEMAQQQPAPSTPAEQGELVRSVANEIADAAGDSGNPDNWTPEAHAAILAVAGWIRHKGWGIAANMLYREVGR